MKNKSAVLFILGFLAFSVGHAYAASGVRGAKNYTASAQSTSVVWISSGPTTVYSVVLGTGAVTDFVALFDSAAVTGLSATLQTSGNFRLRVHAVSTAVTNLVFDPPLVFRNGLVAIPATALMSVVIEWEKGSGLMGY